MLIVLDTARPDHLSAYGYDRPTSPALEKLAAEGVLFEQAVSSAPWTLPSMATILSGKRYSDVYDEGLEESIVESIAAAGYATAAITEGGYVSRAFGFDRGFMEWVEEEGAVQGLQPGEEYDADPTGGIENTFRLATEWIRAHRQERFFLMIHTYEPHTPYMRRTFTEGKAPAAFGETFPMGALHALQSGELKLSDQDLTYLTALYDGGIRESDRHVGEFLATLESIGRREDTLVVVTSDHGEELGEHFRSHSADHGHALLDDQMLVPLILHHPRESYPVGRVAAQVRTMDILPTMADLLDAELPDPTEGASLVPMMRGEERRGRLAYGGHTKVAPPRAFLRHLGYKFIVVAGESRESAELGVTFPRHRLFDLQADPRERRNLADREPDLVRQFVEIFGELHATEPGLGPAELPPVTDPKLEERLRSLGYLQ